MDLKYNYIVVPECIGKTGASLQSNGEMQTYLDSALPFGLRSAHKLFSAVADALAKGMQRRGIQYQLHYLDDYLLLGPPGTPVSVQAMSTT